MVKVKKKIKLNRSEKVCVHTADGKRVQFGRFSTDKETDEFYKKYVKPFQI